MIVSRSVFLQLIGPFVMATGILTFVLSMNTVYSLINLIVSKGVSVWSVGLMLTYRLPQFLSVTLPIALVIACFLVLIRLSLDLEITALRASGMSYWRLTQPLWMFGLVITILNLLITTWLQPAGYAAFEQEQLRLLKSHTNKNIQPGVINQDFPETVLYVEERGSGEQDFEGVFLADRKIEDQSMVVVAQEGQFVFNEPDQELVFQLSKGEMHLGSQDVEQLRRLQFEKLDYVFRLPDIVASDRQHIWGVSTLELLNRTKHSAQLELILRVTTPLACVGFAVGSVALGLVNPRSGRTGAYLRALLLVLGYYIIWLLFKEMTFNMRMNPHLMWIPPLVIFLFGCYSIYKAEHNLSNILHVFRKLMTPTGGPKPQ